MYTSSSAPYPGVSQLPTVQLVVCQSGISIVSVFIEAVKQKVLHREWQSRSLNYGAERRQQLWKDGMSSQRGLARRIRSRCTFINVATHEMPRTVPKFISSTELKRGKGPAQVRNCYIAGLGLKTERVFFITQSWQTALYFCFCFVWHCLFSLGQLFILGVSSTSSNICIVLLTWTFW